ncbi:anhydro-N-acetylmuramic acid kinase [Gluconacetobacter takamatsuzukensis]|uniref:Anhydro-N-acetylmuramic acid kinase n=1 Tax=Gluconacetobacter takamatsuzukensis TaxID=1286190 RepID=A0A7W4KD78_9PROT|nr:anhydro-N-acetylmuramic acid kinase [Gluconacetobacter takamatsuzukensis]MBB2204741.1 anhydro-N-acetylmuramic acid kinase [Gluconacetobacter takamatsuzukensis]
MIRVIGLMSGTSLDGVDAAAIETDGVAVGAAGPVTTIPFPPGLRARARAILDRAGSLAADDPDLLAVERELTQLHVAAVRALDWPAELIGFHGQTILHRPDVHRSWQIGDAGLLAAETGVPVVHDFRSADLAAGGEGAPLVPVFHQALARGLEQPLAVLNIGGVANVSLIGASGELLACDVGPGNALLDDWAMRHTGLPCDRDGAMARAGRVDERVLERLMDDPFFDRPAPKSLDRLSFHRAMDLLAGLSPVDGAATLAAFTVRAVAGLRLPFRPCRWLVCGGGRHNPVLMDGLRDALGAVVEPVEAVGWQGDALEAQCFGFLAARTVRGLPLSFPGTTGVGRPVSGGRLEWRGLPAAAMQGVERLRRR